MINKLIKKIWFICLWFASLSLVGCFHVPDEDWLPSKNKINTWNIEKENEMNQAIDSFMDWINTISSQRNEIKDNENKEVENIEQNNIINDENTSWISEEIISSQE